MVGVTVLIIWVGMVTVLTVFLEADYLNDLFFIKKNYLISHFEKKKYTLKLLHPLKLIFPGSFP